MSFASLPGFTDDDYSTLGERITEEPDERERHIEEVLRWLIGIERPEPWTDLNFRAAAVALSIAAGKAVLQ